MNDCSSSQSGCVDDHRRRNETERRDAAAPPGAVGRQTRRTAISAKPTGRASCATQVRMPAPMDVAASRSFTTSATAPPASSSVRPAATPAAATFAAAAQRALRAGTCRSRARAACRRARRSPRRGSRPRGRDAGRSVPQPECRRRRRVGGRSRAAAGATIAASARRGDEVFDDGERRHHSGGGLGRPLAVRVAFLDGEIEDVGRHHLAAHRRTELVGFAAPLGSGGLGDRQPLLLHHQHGQRVLLGHVAVQPLLDADRGSRAASRGRLRRSASRSSS